MRNFAVTLILIALLVSSAPAADWGRLQFLIGHWTGEGDGTPGAAAGGFSFAEDLQGAILVRKNFANYPAQNGKPAFRHDDLMIVYRSEDQRLRAMYLDNEGHSIPYKVDTSSDAIVFTSEGPEETMRFRFTYTKNGAAAVRIKFEIAPPGKELATYIEATAHRDVAKK